MSYANLMSIGEKFNLPSTVLDGVAHEIQMLRPSDIMTRGRLARNVHLNIDFAENILVELVNIGVMRVVIVVECMNDDHPHYVWFDSYNDFAMAAMGQRCTDCGASLDFKNAKVGFKVGKSNG